MVTPYRIVIADKHGPYRESLKKILTEIGEWDVVGEVSDGSKLLDLLHRLALNQLIPHMVILDISMPVLWGIESTRQIKRAYPEMKVLILSMDEGREYLDHSLMSGAEGYLLKEDAAQELFSAINKIQQGGVYISSRMSKPGEPGEVVR